MVDGLRGAVTGTGLSGTVTGAGTGLSGVGGKSGAITGAGFGYSMMIGCVFCIGYCCVWEIVVVGT